MYSEQTEGIPDISMIEDKLLQCQYSTISEFFEDLTSYFDGIVTVYNSSSEYPDYGRNAEKVLREIKKIIENLSSEETSSRTIGGIEKQIGKLVETDVGSPGLPPERTDLTKLAQSLNQLKGKERIKAEFIIKLHCPFLPYYSSGVDLAQLPYPAIESLQQLVNV
ncbi:hypothetical protein GPJ56_000952 [Histomonas meleagridis]|uniref:uncharacterized protein n=1 Tax=Histomonas meleagridis TaxID=135588 RepID=UPI00355A3F92|nr:hypothetical protein GPJ56_000952 [Histomonas meleagridis]KAH0803787.1 hypothetical protein GO595_002617 [Histomonas meleagridis]